MTVRVSEDMLTALRRAQDLATPGIWCHTEQGIEALGCGLVIPDPQQVAILIEDAAESCPRRTPVEIPTVAPGDWNWIVTVHEALPILIEELEALRAAVAE